MERFFILDKFNTWYDWRCILTAKEITPPEPKTNYVDIDGKDGTLDLTEALTGNVVYNDREITATFWTDAGTRAEREKLLQNIRTSLHGRKIKIVEPDDPDHYFYGRVVVNSTVNIVPYAELKISAVCEPWRYALEESSRYVSVSNETVDVVIRNNGSKILCPDIVVTGNITITYNGDSVNVRKGTYKISNLKLQHGINVVGISGNGTITFVYREGVL